MSHIWSSCKQNMEKKHEVRCLCSSQSGWLRRSISRWNGSSHSPPCGRTECSSSRQVHPRFILRVFFIFWQLIRKPWCFGEALKKCILLIPIELLWWAGQSFVGHQGRPSPTLDGDSRRKRQHDDWTLSARGAKQINYCYLLHKRLSLVLLLQNLASTIINVFSVLSVWGASNTLPCMHCRLYEINQQVDSSSVPGRFCVETKSPKSWIIKRLKAALWRGEPVDLLSHAGGCGL